MLRSIFLATLIGVAGVVLAPSDVLAGEPRVVPKVGAKRPTAPSGLITAVGAFISMFVLVPMLVPLLGRKKEIDQATLPTFTATQVSEAKTELARLDSIAWACLMGAVTYPPIVTYHLDNARADISRGEIGAANYALRLAARRAGW